jgi:hypothetical protein
MRTTARVWLVPGRVKVPDRPGHHDYLAGCRLLAQLLAQTPGVETRVAEEGWPEDARAFDAADGVLYYGAGGGRQPFLRSPERIAQLQALAERGLGLAMLHQAVDTPAEHAERAASWLGGATIRGRSRRGHWGARHEDFPTHPISRGVTPWSARDGWICDVQFVAGLRGVSPLLWARPGRASQDVVAWAFERPSGGRSFCFSGLDSHAAWSLPGLRQLIVNGVLWSAGLEIPEEGAPCAADPQLLTGGLTPRGSLAQLVVAQLRKRLPGRKRRRARSA